MNEVKTPTQKQIDHCEVMGWDYAGDGLFESKEQRMMGWFTESGFNKESL